MILKLKRSLFLFSLMLLFIPFQVALADTGPKPTMEFNFAEADVTIVSGILYECDQPDCSDAAPLEELGPQRLYCEAASCRAIAYGFAPYHILEIEFSDGVTRASNIFETVGFESRYNVSVNSDSLLVEPQFGLGMIPRTGTFLLLCACTLFGGLLVVAGVVFFLRRRTAT